MMPRIRPKERDALARILEEPAADTTDLANRLIVSLDAMRAARTDWYVLVTDPGVGVFLHGAFITKNAAQKAIDKGLVIAASPGATARIMQLIKHDEIGEQDV